MTVDQCAYSGLPISHPEAFVCSDPGNNLHADIARLGKNMLLIKPYGYVSSSAESELQAFIDDFISRQFKSDYGIVYIEDYADITGGDAESRKKYIAYLKNNNRFIGVVLFNLPPIYKISFNLAKKLHFYASRAHAVHTYDQAVSLALKLTDGNNASRLKDHDIKALLPDTGNRPPDTAVVSRLSAWCCRIFAELKGVNVFFTQKARSRLKRELSDELLKYIASIDWQKPGLPSSANISQDDVSSKKVFDAISFVKSEIDTLMEERASAEAAIRESEARYRLLVENAKSGFLEYDYNTRQIISVNEEMIQIAGYSKSELLSIDPALLFTKESRKIFLERLSQINSGKSVSPDVVYQFIRKNGDVWWALMNSNITYQNGRPVRTGAVVTDITKLKQTENKLLEYQEKLKRLSIRLSMIEEDQRRSMASHLHETIGQELFVMQLQINAFEKFLDNPALLSPLTQIKDQLLKIIKETKNLTFDLSPPVLYDFGFQEALKTLSESIELKHNIHVQTYFEGEMDRFDDEIKVILYRNLKELIHNSVKHADAKKIIIRFKNSSSGLYVELSDDGIGFDAESYNSESSSHDGFGLFDIREKLNHLGGRLIIDSTPGKGTAISMQVPLHLRN